MSIETLAANGEYNLPIDNETMHFGAPKWGKPKLEPRLLLVKITPMLSNCSQQTDPKV